MDHMQTDLRGLRASAVVGAGFLMGGIRGVMDFPNAAWGTDRADGCLLFNESLCVAIVVIGLAWFLVQLAGSGSRDSVIARFPLAAALAGTAALVCGALVLGAWNTGIPVHAALLSLGGIAFAAGVLIVGAQWLGLFALLDVAVALRCTALSVALAGCLRFAQTALHHPVASTGFTLMLLLLSVAALASALRLARKGAVSGKDISTAVPEAEGETSRRDQLKQLALLLWMPLVAAMLAGFIQGLVWNPSMSQTSALTGLSLRALSIGIGPLVATIIVLAAVSRSVGILEVRRLQRIGLPVAMAVLLLYPMVGPSEGLMVDVGEIVPQAGFSMVLILIWNALVIAARQFRGAGTLVWTASTALLAASYLGGLLLIAMVGTGGRDLCLVLLTMYLVMLSLSLAQDTQTERHGRVADELRPDAFLHRRCEELTAQFGISPREKEVLFYLGRGYNHTYIAKKLFVSENTVRTHVRHIYGKLDVSSREELLDLIDEN